VSSRCERVSERPAGLGRERVGPRERAASLAGNENGQGFARQPGFEQAPSGAEGVTGGHEGAPTGARISGGGLEQPRDLGVAVTAFE
jgi:hypothetical protein